MSLPNKFISIYKVSDEYNLYGSSVKPKTNFVNDFDFDNYIKNINDFPKELKKILNKLNTGFYYQIFRLGYANNKDAETYLKMKNIPNKLMNDTQIKKYGDAKKNAFNYYSRKQLLNLKDETIIEKLLEVGHAKLDTVAYFEPLNKYMELTLMYNIEEDPNKTHFNEVIDDNKKMIRYNILEGKYWKAIKLMAVNADLLGKKVLYNKLSDFLQSKLGRINYIINMLNIFTDAKGDFKEFINKPFSKETKNKIIDQLNTVVFEIGRIDPKYGDPYKLLNLMAVKSLDDFVKKLKKILNENAQNYLRSEFKK